jgi:uncharacterized MAPEG superfamily protein
MDWVIIVTVLVLLQYTVFGLQVGSMRVKHSVKAPATSGAPEFERMNRVHCNTMEQLILLLPLMWLFAHVVNPTWAAGFGAVFLVGRFLYRSAYLKDPSGRSAGFTISFLPSAVMAIWLLIAAIRNLL